MTAPRTVAPSPEVVLRRYVLRSDGHGEGWAKIVIGSDGFFAAVSDYGNYAFIWSHHGCRDFREFLIRASRDWDYFVRKFDPKQLWDRNAVEDDIRRRIIEWRRDGRFTREEARAEWDLADDADFNDEVGFWQWAGETTFPDAFEHTRYMLNPQCVAFVKKTMGERLAPILRAELDAEKGATDAA